MSCNVELPTASLGTEPGAEFTSTDAGAKHAEKFRKYTLPQVRNFKILKIFFHFNFNMLCNKSLLIFELKL